MRTLRYKETQLCGATPTVPRQQRKRHVCTIWCLVITNWVIVCGVCASCTCIICYLHKTSEIIRSKNTSHRGVLWCFLSNSFLNLFSLVGADRVKNLICPQVLRCVDEGRSEGDPRLLQFFLLTVWQWTVQEFSQTWQRKSFQCKVYFVCISVSLSVLCRTHT